LEKFVQLFGVVLISQVGVPQASNEGLTKDCALTQKDIRYRQQIKNSFFITKIYQDPKYE
jgi:hypothetical protein